MKSLSSLEQLQSQDDDLIIHTIRVIGMHANSQMDQWNIVHTSYPSRPWITFRRKDSILPDQGWKLHVAASVTSAKEVLQRILPLLFTSATSFKIISSLPNLEKLNGGDGGASQISKFVTIYPKDDSEAVKLARAIDEATRGLSGPNVPSDRSLRPDSLVHYRYGGFTGKRYLQRATGLLEPALLTPDNQLVPDHRGTSYAAPEWAADPFMAAGIVVEQPALNRLLSGRYLIMVTIAASINHILYLGTDLESGRTCIIKGLGYAFHNNTTPHTAREILRNEADILRSLTPNPHIPAFIDLVEDQHKNLFLVMEDIEGETVMEYLSQKKSVGEYIALEHVFSWGKKLAELLAAIHAQGIIYADLKPTNVLLGNDYSMHIIDFELSHRDELSVSVGDTRQVETEGNDLHVRIKGRGTRGYMSPQQATGQASTILDDIYSLGVLLYVLATGAEASQFPHPFDLLRRPLTTLRPGIGTALCMVIERCLHPSAQARYASMEEVKVALEDAEKDHSPVSYNTSSADNPANREHSRQREHYRNLSYQLLQTLSATAQSLPDTSGLFWISNHSISHGLASHDLNTGNAGTNLAMAELVAEHADAQMRSVLSESSHWLLTSSAPVPHRLPGLYVGMAGRGAALLRAGQVLHDDALIVAAITIGREIATLPFTATDLFSGSAGRLRFHLFLWDATGEREHLEAAIACGEHLIATALPRNGYCWSSPAEKGAVADQFLLGYAHGAAGIADTLLDLFEATENERLLPIIQGAGQWLKQQAVPVLSDSSRLNWPKAEGQAPTAAFWCHGATGIGRFFLHAGSTGVLPEALALAVGAAQSSAYGTRWADPTHCHGLSGNIEFLLDMYQATSNSCYLTNALTLAQLLEAFLTDREGHLMFPSESPTLFTPDYMVGYAGVAVCLLRLSAPERLPYQLSRAGFCRCSPRRST